MPTTYATCGLSFSGKTTLAKRLAKALSIPRISLDAINTQRGLRGGEGMTDVQWEETSAIAMERLSNVLKTGQSVVLDDTLSHRFLRDRYRTATAEVGAEFVLLFVDTAIEEIERRRARNHIHPLRHNVTDEVFEEHKNRFQRPTHDERPVLLVSEADIGVYFESLKLFSL